MFSVDQDLKNEFLTNVERDSSKSSLKNMKYILKKIDEYEYNIGMSIYRFDEENMLNIIKKFNLSSFAEVTSHKSFIKTYLEFCAGRTSQLGLKVIANLSKDNLVKTINQDSGRSQYLTEDEYNEFLRENITIYNSQDLAIAILLWHGLKGKEYIDIRKLKANNYSRNNSKISYTSEENQINYDIKLSELENEIMIDCVQNLYYKRYEKSNIEPRNGNPKYSISTKYELCIDSPYLIKSISKEKDAETTSEINIRISNMLARANKKGLTGGSLYTSGRVYTMLKENGFKKLVHKEAMTWMGKRGYRIASNKISEIQDIMRYKLGHMDIVSEESDSELLLSSSKKKIICGGIIYNSLTDFAKSQGVSLSAVSKWLKGSRTMPNEFKEKGLSYYEENQRINLNDRIIIPNYDEKVNMECDLLDDDSLLKIIVTSSEYKVKNARYLGVPQLKREVQQDPKGVKKYPRKVSVSKKALFLSQYRCDIDISHETFIRKNGYIPYTEPHHLIPLSAYNDFKYSLDVEENIVSLCSHCHNLLHYGAYFEVVLMKLYNERKDMLKQVGLEISFEQLKKYYLYSDLSK